MKPRKLTTKSCSAMFLVAALCLPLVGGVFNYTKSASQARTTSGNCLLDS